MSDDLVKRLQTVSAMISLGERISWGQDTALMDEAAAEMTRLRAKVEAAEKLAERASELEKQAKNAVRLGASTGPHWVKLGLAQMRTAAALSTFQESGK
jgi:uncharacterized protein YPO0396